MGTRMVVCLDAAFEALLGAVLVAGVTAGWLGSDDFAAPVTTEVAAAFGIGLLGLAAVLWRLSSSANVRPPLMLVLAAFNGLTALIGALWGLTGEGFSTSGTVLLWITATVLALLSGVQVRLAVRRAGESFQLQR
jgi:peptidoglycan/LPS O-acetylase OafA/YrhL